MTFEQGLMVAIASDLLNVIFIIGGHKLVKLAKRKQDKYSNSGGGVTGNGMAITFVWLATLGMGLIVAWAFPLKFHEFYCYVTGFDYRIGLVAKLTQVVLVTQILYVIFRAPEIMLQVGRVCLAVVLPICLIAGHYLE